MDVKMGQDWQGRRHLAMWARGISQHLHCGLGVRMGPGRERVAELEGLVCRDGV